MSSQQLKAAATGRATPTEARNPFDQFKRQLENGKAEFLPLFGGSQQNADRFIRVALNSVLSNPDLLDADRRSLIAACMKAAQDGLMPDGREAVLNVYNTKKKINGRDEWIKMAQYLPMVGGLVKKLYESGEVTYIDAACVYANDRFTYRRGDEPRLEHEPTMADDPGPIVAAYAVIKLKNGEIKREVMPKRDIDAVRGASKSKDNGPWVTWFDQQAIKSVIKRAYKQLPKADAFEKIADYDNQALGFGATPHSVGEIIGHQAIEHQPGEVLEPMTIKQAEAVPVVSYASVMDGMIKAKNLDALDDAAALMGGVSDEAQKADLSAKYEELRSFG